MRTLNKNKRTLYFSTYKGETAYLDENGDSTGEYIASYFPPEKVRMNIAAAKGDAERDPFGISEPYTNTLVTADMDCAMDESSVIWIGANPILEEASFGQMIDGKMHWFDSDSNEIGQTDAYSHVVVRKAESVNSITYAIRKVSTNAE